MNKNDFRTYQKAVKDYSQNDGELMHWRTKGSKNGVSTTPGYKAIGEKAKGILNSAGQYIYDTAKKVGSAATGTATAAINAAKRANSKVLGSNVANTKRLTGSIARKNEEAAAKDRQISNERRATGSIARKNEEAAEIKKAQSDMAPAISKFQSETKKAEDAKKESARREDKMDKMDARDDKSDSLARSRAQKKAQEEAVRVSKEEAEANEADASVNAATKVKKEWESGNISKSTWDRLMSNASGDIMDQVKTNAQIALKAGFKEDTIEKIAQDTASKYGVSVDDLLYGKDNASKTFYKDIASARSLADFERAYATELEKQAKEFATKNPKAEDVRRNNKMSRYD